MLQNQNVQQHYGNRGWKFILQEWRSWWLPSLTNQFFYRDISMDTPPSYFCDKTKDYMEFHNEKGSGVLSRTGYTINKHLMPTVLCPWGCSEYMHKE